MNNDKQLEQGNHASGHGVPWRRGLADWVRYLAFGRGAVRAAPQRTAGEADIGNLPAAQLAAAVPDPLYVVDRTGGVVHANKAANTAFGPIDIGASLLLKFRTPEMHELVEHISSGAGAVYFALYLERVPVERNYQITATRIDSEAGLFALLFRDQSETRRIDRMRADFIANASHELRTPLASVTGFIETLRGPAREDPQARERFLQIMQNQTERMARLIDDLLSLSRLEMKPYAKPTEAVDLVALVAGIVDSMAHLVAEAGLTVEKRFPDQPVRVLGHSDELVQVFSNLIENACKYGGDGGRIIVTIEQRASDGAALVSVRDFGPGIAQEHIPRVTERFYRVDVETSRAQKGTGLGLSIVKHILTRHDGWLSIRSTPGEGAQFIVHLPPAETL